VVSALCARPVNSGVRRRVESKQCYVILSKGLPLPPRLDAASSQAYAFVSFTDSSHAGPLVAACSIPPVASCVAYRVGWYVAWSVKRVVEWLRSAGAVNPAPPNKSFDRSAKSMAFIRQLEWLVSCFRARSIPALDVFAYCKLTSMENDIFLAVAFA
jgi:hypothetical protein